MTSRTNTPAGGRKARGRAFTLVELLLVVAIMGVIVAVTMPAFVNSMRGHRRRAAARTVVMAGKYARNMALLNQQDMAVVFDLADAQVSVLWANPRPASASYASSNEFGGGRAAILSDFRPAGADGGVSNAPAGLARNEISRKLDQVKIEYVEIGGDRKTEGTARVVYESNGRCTPYRVGIVDDQKIGVTIEVDALASARTEGGRQ